MTTEMLALARNEDKGLQENTVLLMSGSWGAINMRGRSVRRSKWDFIPRFAGKLYPDQDTEHSTLSKVQSVLSYPGLI